LSKRSSRRKRQENKQKQDARLSGPILARQGYQAFQQADYDNAIKLWEQATHKNDAPAALPAALAEAYFRLAMSRPAPVKNLEQAVKLQPNDATYRYHLALAHHRAGSLDKAEPIYRHLLKLSPPFIRAAEPLAQLLIEQKQAVLTDPVWALLAAEQQQQLTAAEALIKKKAASTLHHLAETPLHPIWQGLVAMALGHSAAATAALNPLAAPDSPVSPSVRSVARYYLGLAIAETGQLAAALAHWQAARSDGLDNYPLRQNISAAAFELAIQARQANQPQQAQTLLDQIDYTAGIQSDVRAFAQQLDWEVGYAAAQKGNWQQALTNWQRAEKAGDDSRPLLFNLALAYQQQELFLQAADHWRTLLRRRPRKADHPDALTDSQVARIWQNVAENYSKTGEYEEAITTYRNALKWAPENLDIRLKLVEALQNEGRWQAAGNELNRILEKDPDNIPALVLLAESYGDDYFVERPRELWRRILKLEPQHPIARQQLAHTFEVESLRWTSWGHNYQEAIKVLKAGLQEVPDSQRLLTITGSLYADWGKFDQARDYLTQALARNPDDAQTLHTIFTIWLQHKSLPDLERTLERLKALSAPLPFSLFIDLSARCFKFDQPELAEQILDFVTHKYATDAEARVAAASGYVELDQERKALPILRQVLKEQPDHIGANMELGFVYYYTDQTRLAKRQWDKASELARKANDHMLVHQIKLVKDEFLYDKRPSRNPFEMLADLPPHLLEQMLKDAPPDIAAMLRNMSPRDILNLMADFDGFDEDDDDFMGNPFF
jgi:tetratricopeptide (TPR) repeat protein